MKDITSRPYGAADEVLELVDVDELEMGYDEVLVQVDGAFTAGVEAQLADLQVVFEPPFADIFAAAFLPAAHAATTITSAGHLAQTCALARLPGRQTMKVDHDRT